MLDGLVAWDDGDVHVARHQDHIPRQEGAEARRCGRYDAHAELLVAVLERDLVSVLEQAQLLRLDLPQLEVLDDRGLGVFVDDPLTVAFLRDADLAPVERRDRFFDSHRTSAKIADARSQSSSDGTSARRA